MNIAIIPARGGSQRIPRKNIKFFHGQPMIAWSIQTAIKTKCFDRIIVSTDDEEIANIAKNFGAEVPFLRPLHLSDNHTSTGKVVQHALHWLDSNGTKPDAICCIYATAPLMRSEDLIGSKHILSNHPIDYVFSATEFNFPIQRAFYINDQEQPVMFQPEHMQTRSQDLTKAFHDAGQFYWGTADAWKFEKPIFSINSRPLLIPTYRTQDIDTHEDWLRAEMLFSLLSNENFTKG